MLVECTDNINTIPMILTTTCIESLQEYCHYIQLDIFIVIVDILMNMEILLELNVIL